MENNKAVNVVPLTDKNYPTWKLQIKMTLMKDGLYNIVNGTELPPEGGNELNKFNQRKDRALATIVLAIDPSLLYLVGDPNDPVAVWTLLQNTFMKKTWANKLALKRKLYNTRMNNNDSLQSHLKIFSEIYESLAVVGSPMEDEDKVITMLASLPEKFSTVVTALETLENVPSWESVTEKLLHEESKLLNNNTSTTNDNQLLMVKQKKTIKCFECGKLGHLKKNCYVYKRKNKHKNNFEKANSVVQNNKNVKSDESITLIASALNVTSERSNTWIIDSGSTNHMCNNKDSFCDYKELLVPTNIEVGNGKCISAIGKGKINMKMKLPDGNMKSCILQNVLLVPELAYNLLSVSQITGLNKCIWFSDNICKITDKNNKLLCTGSKCGKLYILNCSNEMAGSSVNFKETLSEQQLWHNRFCHLGITNLKRMNSNNIVKGMSFSVNDDSFFCKNCVDGKIHRTPFPKNDSKRERMPFELIHSDICGKLNPLSLGGGQYFVTFIDDASRYTWVYILKNKSEVFSIFKDWKKLVENQYGVKIKILRSDNGGEYTSNEFEMFLKKEGILHHKTVPKNPEQNGVSERYNRTIIEGIRSMLSGSKLPKEYWAEALSTAVYTRNRCTSTIIGNKTPYEILNGRKPNVKHLKVFGCTAFAHIPHDERQKLDSKAKECVFLGYSNVTKGYRLYDINKKKIFFSRDVVFCESEFLNNQVQKERKDEPCPSIHIEETQPSHNDELEQNETSNEYENPNVDQTRRSQRQRKSPNRLGEWVYSCINENDPLTFQEALSRPDADKWREAIKVEMEAMHSNNVWNLVENPKEKNIVQCRWVFKKKIKPDGTVGSYKARLVAKGFQQKEGIDYNETFSPVVRFESIRTILAIAANLDLNVHHMDVTSAFLNGDLEDEIYMYQPEYFDVKNDNLVCKLNKSIYGLKQSPKCWNINLDNFLKKQGFSQSNADSCIYNKFDNNEIFIVAVYVDDLLLVCKSIDKINELKSCLNSSYKMKDLGKLEYFLGVNVCQQNEKIFIHQSTYVELLLDKYGLKDANSVSTPSDPSLTLEKATDKCKIFNTEIYQSAVGSLLYLCTKTRPDITFSVCNVAKFCSKPTFTHWSAVKRIFRYLKGTIDYGLLYSKQDLNCIGYSDADWAGDKSDRKSTSGYCFKLSSSIISWRSSKQTCVALSTAEAEYVALATTVQEAVWIQELLKDLKLNSSGPMTINEDNQSAICIAKNSGNHAKTKHISIKYHFIRDLIQKSIIKLKYCPTNEMIADLFTKSLSREKFLKLCSLIGLISFSCLK